MIKCIHIYKNKEEKESAIDRVWALFDSMNFDKLHDYETKTFYPANGDIVLQIWLNSRIQNLHGLEDKVKSMMVEL
jgi:hypothetical protein